MACNGTSAVLLGRAWPDEACFDYVINCWQYGMAKQSQLWGSFRSTLAASCWDSSCQQVWCAQQCPLPSTAAHTRTHLHEPGLCLVCELAGLRPLLHPLTAAPVPSHSSCVWLLSLGHDSSMAADAAALTDLVCATGCAALTWCVELTTPGLPPRTRWHFTVTGPVRHTSLTPQAAGQQQQ